MGGYLPRDETSKVSISIAATGSGKEGKEGDGGINIRRFPSSKKIASCSPAPSPPTHKIGVRRRYFVSVQLPFPLRTPRRRRMYCTVGRK